MHDLNFEFLRDWSVAMYMSLKTEIKQLVVLYFKQCTMYIKHLPNYVCRYFDEQLTNCPIRKTRSSQIPRGLLQPGSVTL
jgi:hypothetical protein